MPVDVSRLKAVLFDYGNTVIEYSRRQADACDEALAQYMEREIGPLDRARLRAIRDADRIAPFSDNYRENDLPAITANLIRELYALDPPQRHVEGLLQVRFDTVIALIEVQPHVQPLLEQLSRRWPLGLVSNYPDGRAIRASLQRLALARFFKAVVVSADVGLVKPHPTPFLTCLRQLDVEPASALYIGDNWLADVQGAKRLGMQVVRCTQWEAVERFERQPGDVEPDDTIGSLAELEAVLRDVHAR